METENLLIKDNVKKVVEEDSSIITDDLKDVHDPNHARTHVPSVFEHQYAEYISGLKPPYFHHRIQKDQKNKSINGD